MASTLNQIVYNIKNVHSGGLSSSDFPFSDENIAYWVQYYGNMLRKAEIEKQGYIDDSNIQDLGCVPLTKVDVADCDVKYGYDVKKVALPSTLRIVIPTPSITFFGMIDKQTSIPFRDADAIQLNKYVQFPKAIKLSAWQDGNTIYVLGANAVNLCYVNVRGVFENPAQIATFKIGESEMCYDWDSTYPINDNLLPQLYSLIRENELNVAQKQIQIIRHEKGGEELKPI